MFQFYNTNIKQIVEKYKEIVVESLTNPEFNVAGENAIHTRYISQCSRGDKVAKEYVRNNIKEVLKLELATNDKKVIFNTIEKEINTFNQKLYEIYNIKEINIMKERKISYYQLMSLYASDSQRKKI